jgi:transcriptional regulator with XRE-family HTH domain
VTRNFTGTLVRVERDNPVLLRQEIGRRLRAARESVGLNITQGATRLVIGTATLSRIETGVSLVPSHLLRVMTEAYRLDDEELEELVRQARAPGWWRQFGISDRHFIALESGASRLGVFEPDLVPGLLQTADYARSLFNAGMRTRRKGWIDSQLEVRMIRQERLVDEENALELDAVVSEFALCRPVGGSEVMRAQLRHLALVTELPTVTLRLLPASVVSTPALSGGFVILDFPSVQPGIVYLEHLLGQEKTEKPEPVAKTRLRLDHLRSLALDPQESVVLIERMANNS